MTPQFTHRIGLHDGPAASPGTEWLHLLFWFLVFAAVLGTAIYIARLIARNPRVQGDVRDPLEIARARYARGEITKAELADIKKELLAK